MSFGIKKDELVSLRNRFPIGCRVELTRFGYDPYPGRLTVGCKGTVEAVDDIGTIHVRWDCGSSLGVAYGEDECKRID